MTANNSTNYNAAFFFCFRFENNILLQLLILDNNILDQRENILCHFLVGDKIIQNCPRKILQKFN